MLVVRVEVWPAGDAAAAFEIARVGLANVTGTDPISDYEMTALMARDRAEYVLKGEINKHERGLGWEPLVRRAVSSLFLSETVSHAASYYDPVADLLRKGRHG